MLETVMQVHRAEEEREPMGRVVERRFNPEVETAWFLKGERF